MLIVAARWIMSGKCRSMNEGNQYGQLRPRRAPRCSFPPDVEVWAACCGELNQPGGAANYVATV